MDDYWKAGIWLCCSGLPDQSSMSKKEQDAYAMHMSLQEAEFGQAQSPDIIATSPTNTSWPSKKKISYDVMQDPEFLQIPRELSWWGSQ